MRPSDHAGINVLLVGKPAHVSDGVAVPQPDPHHIATMILPAILSGLGFACGTLFLWGFVCG